MPVLRDSQAREAIDLCISAGTVERSFVDPEPRASLRIQVPDGDALTYLASCRLALSGAELECIEAEFDLGHRTVSDLVGVADCPPESEIISTLRDLIGAAASRNQMVARARGAQAAALKSGIHLQIDIDHFARASRLDDLRLHLSDEDWQRISRAADPQGAAVAALAVTGLDPTTITHLTESDICLRGTYVTTPDHRYEVPSPGQSLLVAHSIFRALMTSPGQSQFCMGRRNHEQLGPRAVSTLLVSISRITGIRLRQSHADWQRGRSQWANRWGISARRLA